MKKEREFAAQWLHKAQNDLISAKQIASLEDGPTDTVCFHAQQAVEKALKGLLTLHGIEFPRIHNLIRLLDLVLPVKAELNEFRNELALMSNYAVQMRYPGTWIEPDRSEALEAIATAEKVVTNISEQK